MDMERVREHIWKCLGYGWVIPDVVLYIMIPFTFEYFAILFAFLTSYIHACLSTIGLNEAFFWWWAVFNWYTALLLLLGITYVLSGSYLYKKFPLLTLILCVLIWIASTFGMYYLVWGFKLLFNSFIFTIEITKSQQFGYAVGLPAVFFILFLIFAVSKYLNLKYLRNRRKNYESWIIDGVEEVREFIWKCLENCYLMPLAFYILITFPFCELLLLGIASIPFNIFRDLSIIDSNEASFWIWVVINWFIAFFCLWWITSVLFKSDLFKKLPLLTSILCVLIWIASTVGMYYLVSEFEFVINRFRLLTYVTIEIPEYQKKGYAASLPAAYILIRWVSEYLRNRCKNYRTFRNKDILDEVVTTHESTNNLRVVEQETEENERTNLITETESLSPLECNEETEGNKRTNRIDEVVHSSPLENNERSTKDAKMPPVFSLYYHACQARNSRYFTVRFKSMLQNFESGYTEIRDVNLNDVLILHYRQTSPKFCDYEPPKKFPVKDIWPDYSHPFDIENKDNDPRIVIEYAISMEKGPGLGRTERFSMNFGEQPGAVIEHPLCYCDNSRKTAKGIQVSGQSQFNYNQGEKASFSVNVT